MDVIIDLGDVNKLKAAFEAAPEDMIKALRKVMGTEGVRVQRGAQQNHRFKVRTGDLERSIREVVEPNGLGFEVDVDKSGAPYGDAVQVGHGSWSPDPFIVNSFERNQATVIKNITLKTQEALEKALEKRT